MAARGSRSQKDGPCLATYASPAPKSAGTPFRAGGAASAGPLPYLGSVGGFALDKLRRRVCGATVTPTRLQELGSASGPQHRPPPAPPDLGDCWRRPLLLSQALAVPSGSPLAVWKVLSSTCQCLFCPAPEVLLLLESKAVPQREPSSICWQICVQGDAVRPLP